MIVIRRQLFWKVYLTLLSSLVTVAVLMGCLWWFLGDMPRERWGAFHVRLTDQVLPLSNVSPAVLADAIRAWGEQMDADISVYDSRGALMAAHGRPIPLPADADSRHEPRRVMRIDLADGRSVLTRLRLPPGEPGWHILEVMLVVAGGVGLAAFPMTARLTRKLEGVRSVMEQWGEGALATRVDETGSDEVALVARTFNKAAARLEGLLTAQRALLANASHELRSPLARLRIAIELWLVEPAPTTHHEIVRNLVEVDQLVEEILLSSRLDHASAYTGRNEVVDLLGLAAEEAARVGASVAGTPMVIDGNATLLRRLLRNLLENALKHGHPPVEVAVSGHGGEARIVVSDGGRGIAPEERERVFEPFYRPAGRSEADGGWGLGLSLVRQIALRHGGRVECEAPSDGGSRFVVHLKGTTALNDAGRSHEPSIHDLNMRRDRPRDTSHRPPKAATLEG